MSDVAMTENSIALLNTAIDAAGGLERWQTHTFLSAHLSQVRSSFTPRRVELRGADGKTVEALDNPGGSFAGHAFGYDPLRQLHSGSGRASR